MLGECSWRDSLGIPGLKYENRVPDIISSAFWGGNLTVETYFNEIYRSLDHSYLHLPGNRSRSYSQPMFSQFCVDARWNMVFLLKTRSANAMHSIFCGYLTRKMLLKKGFTWVMMKSSCSNPRGKVPLHTITFGDSLT